MMHNECFYCQYCPVMQVLITDHMPQNPKINEMRQNIRTNRNILKNGSETSSSLVAAGWRSWCSLLLCSIYVWFSNNHEYLMNILIVRVSQRKLWWRSAEDDESDAENNLLMWSQKHYHEACCIVGNEGTRCEQGHRTSAAESVDLILLV